jgi:hypothetical protein
MAPNLAPRTAGQNAEQRNESQRDVTRARVRSKAGADYRLGLGGFGPEIVDLILVRVEDPYLSDPAASE